MANFTSEQLEGMIKSLENILNILKTAITNEPLKIDYPFSGNFLISQKFGENPALYKAYGFAGHFGIDFLTPWGTPILACSDGEVSRVGLSTGDGFFIELKHSWGFSYYCHFKEASTRTISEKVFAGEPIGYAGNTGRVFSNKPLSDKLRGTHLHFSIKVNGIKNPDFKDWKDPQPYFKT